MNEADVQRLWGPLSLDDLLARYPGHRGNRAVRRALAAAFENDRHRDRKLAACGWRPVRVTWRQLTWERDELEADLRRMLARSTLAA